MNIGERLNRKGDKINFYYDYRRESGQRPSTSVWIYAHPKTQTEKNHNRAGSGTPLTMENVFNVGTGEISRSFYTGQGAGLTDFAVIPHFTNPHFQEACGLNAEKWAARIPAPVYEQTAIKIVAGQVEVVSEGEWKFFARQATLSYKDAIVFPLEL